MTKPQMDLSRPLSWSAISSFEWNPEQWYQSYVLGIRTTSPEMEFGSYVDKRLQKDPTFLPDVPRYPLMQHLMEAKFGKIKLKGLPDGLDLDNFILADYKTGKKAWDLKRTQETGQLKMYLLLIWLTEKIPPEKFTCRIHWLPTCVKPDLTIGLIEPCVCQTFEVKITMQDILEFGVRINKTYAAMQEYAANHP